MPFQIEIQNQDADAYEINVPRLQEASAAVLAWHDVYPDSCLTIVIADNGFVRSLNCRYRGVDSPTDILSFPADSPPVDMGGEPPYLGDLIIAYPYAAAQASREGHALDDSLVLLVVHGTLHLLGYDHDTDANRAEMWEAQDDALRVLGISLTIAPELEVASHDDPA